MSRHLSFVIEQFFNMDDFIFEELSNMDDGEQFMSYFQDEDYISDDHALFPSSKTEELKNTAESDSHVTQESLDKISKNYKEGLFQYETRPKIKIEIVSQTVRKKYVDSKKGNKGDTSDLTANTKTVFKKIFEEARVMNELQPHEISRIQKYIASNSNISAIKDLFGVEESDRSISKIKQSKDADCLRKIFVSKASDSWVVEETLSSKLSFRSKLIALKHLEVLRKSGICPLDFHNWKGPNN